ncbi:uncharacterized protein EV154DRAFT_568887 [Mucor mucedo]|uniref:uncharacterized protein n=1 Tax=Mucor mucedo TaxID=29922 RepID=UPI002220906B|nr:uncharacterized protein EV154DRAFT_568887 [Mucor mucedo]KAI7878543.1 hypothetical protein EV154DRAFT_568887 [Mucor mucedo]
MDPFDPTTFNVEAFLASDAPDINVLDYLDPLPEVQEEQPAAALEEEEEEEEAPFFTGIDDVRFKMGNILREINRMYGERGLAVVDEVLFDVRGDRALEAAAERIRGELLTMPVVVAPGREGGLDEVAGSLLRWHGYCAAAASGQKYLYWAQLLRLVEENVENGMVGMRWGSPLALRLGWKRSKYFRVVRSLRRLQWLVEQVGRSGLLLMVEKVPFNVVEGANDTVWQGWQDTIRQDRHLAFMNTVEF